MSPGNYVKSPSNASAAIEGLYSPGHVRTAKHCYGTSNPVYVCNQKWKSLHVVSRRRVVSHGFLKWIVVIRADKSLHSVRVITSCSGWLRKTAMSHAGQWIDRCWHVKILYNPLYQMRWTILLSESLRGWWAWGASNVIYRQITGWTIPLSK